LLRAKGPVVYLAQANGLGNWRYNFDFGPTAQPFVLRDELKVDAAVDRSRIHITKSEYFRMSFDCCDKTMGSSLMNGMFGIDCGDKWLGRWPELALRDLWTQAVGLGYANGWPFWAGEIPISLLPKVVGYKKASSL
jgi:hypothetical protein